MLRRGGAGDPIGQGRGLARIYSPGVPKLPVIGVVHMPIEKDPVCGMDVDTSATDLKLEHDGTTYWFCGKGCFLEFRDDPERFLDPDYQPSM
jgi:Cu+-exporting ATPase